MNFFSNKLSSITFVLLMLLATFVFAQAPTITSFSPTSGAVGTSVTIAGTGFDANTSQNVVTFGGKRVVISNASATQLSVVVPTGLSSENIVVTNTLTGLSAVSKRPFITTVSSPSLFFPTQINVSTSDPAGVKPADFNNDGLLDFAVVNKTNSTISVFLNNTSGNVASFNSVPIVLSGFGASQIWYLDVSDFDGDGFIDIAVQDYGSGKMHVFRNTTSGNTLSFQFVSSYTIDSIEGLDIADLNGDGKADIITGNYSSNSISFLRNTSSIGTISFATVQNFNSLGSTTCVAAGDIDGDGKNDIVSGPWTGVFKTFLNTSSVGATTLSLSTAVDKTITGNPWGIELADLDADGDLDVILNSSGIRIFLNTSTVGTVSYSNVISLTASGNKSSVGDINGDGKIDILVHGGSNLTVYTNNYSTGTFSSSSFSSSTYNHSLSTQEFSTPFLGDFNGDGKFDIGISANGNIGVKMSGNPPVINSSSNTLNTITNCKTPRVIADHTNVGANINLTQNDLYYNLNGTMNVPSIWVLYQNALTGGYFLSLGYGANSGIVQSGPVSVNSLFGTEGSMILNASNFIFANLPVQFNQATGAITYNGQTFQPLPQYESFTVAGSNLTTALTVTPPANFQVSTDQTTWVANPSAITLALSSGSVASTTVYVRATPNVAANSYSGNITMASAGVTDVTKAVTATILAPTVISSQPTPTVNICQAASYTLGASGTGSGSLSYQWYTNTTNSNIGGTSLGSANFAQTGGLSIVTTTPGTYYYYLIVTGSCGTAISNVTTVVISPTTVAGTAAAAATTVCSGNAATLTLTGNTGTIQWQQSTTLAGTYTNVTGGTGATTASFITPALTATTFYRALVISGTCAAVNSNVVTVTVPPAPRPFKQALNFDGTSDKVVVANNATQQLPNTFTIEAWVKVDPSVAIGSAYMGIATKVTWAASGLGYGLDIDGGKPRIFSGQGYSNWSGAGSPNNIATNTWVHLAGTYDGSNFKMYVDGQLVNTQASATGVSNNTQPFTIGSWSGENKFFKGDIDEVRVWNVARSTAQIQQFKDLELNGNESGLVSYYNFNQGTPSGNNTTITSAIDRTSNALTGALNTFTLTGATSNWIAGGPLILTDPTICLNNAVTITHSNSGGTWSTSDANVVSIDNTTGAATASGIGTATITYTFTDNGCTYTSTKLFTVIPSPAITAHPASAVQDVCLNGTATALSVTATGAGITYQWYKSTTAANTGGTLIAGATSASYTPPTTTAGNFYYYCAVSGTCTPITSNVSGLIKISAASVAGTIAGTASLCKGSTTTLTLSGNVGTIQWQQYNGSTWNDLVGETNQTYTTVALTQNTSYRAVIKSGSCSSTTTSNFNITIITSSAVGNALNFDGVNDVVSVPNSNDVNFAGNNANFTLEAWVKINAGASSINTIIGKKSPGGGTAGYSFYINSWSTSDRKLVLETTNGVAVSNNAVPSNTWTHVAVAVSNGTATFYINGVDAGGAGAVGPTVTTTTLNIGAFGSGSYFNFSGSLEEVRIWDVARSNAEILNNKDLSVTGQPGLKLYYKFNSTTGTVAKDNGPLALDGALNNFALAGATSNWLMSSFMDTASILGTSTICANSTSVLTHPVAGGTWASSDTNVATINQNGVVSSVVPGTSTISYTYALNNCQFSDTFNISIVAAPVITGTTSVGQGEAITLSASTTAASSNAWVSSNPSVATVSSLGVVSGLTIGSTTITYTNSVGCAATQVINVVAGSTQTPILTSPATNTTGATTLQFSYTLPESPLAGSVKLTFTPAGGGAPIVWNMSNATSVAFSNVVGSNPVGGNVTSGTALPFATYSVTLSYQDAFANPVASVTNTNIQTLSAPNISFASATQNKVINVAMSIATQNTGGAGTFTISPALPAGLAINSSTGLISGTVTTPYATRTFTVTATNQIGTSIATFSLLIDTDMDGDGDGDSTDLDIDGDGVPNTIEIQDGTSPTTPGDAKDTDGDGVPDYIELRDSTSPTTPGDAKDTDGDGVPDYIELRDGTSPTTPGAKDTDGDGVPDYIERRDGTSPTMPGDAKDTDGDGVPDYIERRDGTSPTTPGARDTDGDGLSDYYEANNIAPTNISLAPNSISENNLVGAVIGSLTSTDAGDVYAHTYTLVAGTGSTDNTRFTILGNQLKAAIAFDYEIKTSYSIRVKTTDIVGLSFEKVLTVDILDVVENVAPTNIALSANTINENNAIGAVIGNLSSADLDAGDTFTYTLVTGTGSTDNASFTIAGNQLKAGTAFNFETKSSYSVRLRTNDAGGLFFDKVFTITVNNLNEAPTDVALSNANLFESNAVGVNIATLTSTDQDAGSVFTYSLVSGDVAAFTIVGNTLKANTVFNFANKNSYSVRIKTTDAGGLSFEKVFAISISQVPVLTGTGNEIGTNLPTPASGNPEISRGFASQLSVAGSGYTSYSWSPATGLSSTSIANPIARPLQTTTYILTVTNAMGNTATASITVTVNADYYLKANNILTPNGDGKNDTWYIENLNNYPANEIKIFDRTGRLLYTAKNYQNNWNGQVNGAMLAQGTYYYTITFGGNVAPKKGFITLVR